MAKDLNKKNLQPIKDNFKKICKKFYASFKKMWYFKKM